MSDGAGARAESMSRSRVPQQGGRTGGLRPPVRLLVLLVDDEREAARLHEAWMGQAIDLEDCPSLAVALVRIGQAAPDMVVVGATAGSLDAIEFLRALRLVDDDTPVIVGLDDGCMELGSAALLAGATAVVRRPFAAESVLRLLDSSVRNNTFHLKPLPIDLGRLRVDGAATRIWVDGVETIIPAMEHVLLRYLAERHGQIVAREELLAVGWGDRTGVPNNHLNVHLARIRRRFPHEGSVDWLRPVRGIGYQLLVPRPAQISGMATVGS